MESARKQEKRKLVLIAIGKLTNVALALEKAPAIAGKIRLVWLGSNYPEPGEYNLINDTSALQYLLHSLEANRFVRNTREILSFAISLL